MKGSHFKKWAELSHQSYGRDTWFFLRELAQNSRDAGASLIHVEAYWNENQQEVFTFTDNGCGMDFNHARHYLFRLYASSKTNEKFSAGMYGAGFWTILRYRPVQIIIESWAGKDQWAISMDQELKIADVPCTLDNRGTRIQLIRDPHFQTHKDFQSRVKKALIKYCQYLRKSDLSGNRLPVIYQGQDISQPMRLAGPFTHHFRKGPIEGAIGLANEPKVELYAKGLPVWRGTTIDELSHSYTPTINHYEVGSGLAPVFLLNGNNLDVNISRKSVIDNQALKKLRDTARKQLSKLIVHHAEEAFPRSVAARIFDFFSQVRQKVHLTRWKFLILVLLIIIPIEYMVLKNFFPGGINAPPPASILSVSDSKYSGATVTMGQPRNNNQIRYHPPDPLWLRLFTADEYDIQFGFKSSKTESVNPVSAARIDKSKSSIDLELTIEQGGKIYLPQPVGHLVAGDSLMMDNQSVPGMTYTTSSDAMISLPAKKGVLTYRCWPIRSRPLLPDNQKNRWSRLPPQFRMPDDLKILLKGKETLHIADRVAFIIKLTTSSLLYDNSPSTAAEYRSRKHRETNWFSMVRQIGKGDCDILNGMAVVYLRYLKIPSRLVIGFIGRDGGATAGLHAWAEYYDGGWKVLDISSYAGATIRTTEQVASRDISSPDRSATSSQLSGSRGTSNRSAIYVALTLSIFGLMAWATVILLRRRKKEKDPLAIQEIRRTLVQMAVRAILQPEVWGYDSQIWKYRLIPAFNKKNISLRTAFILAGKQKLFTAAPGNPWAETLIKRGFTVLNHLSPEYHSLIQLIPGKIDIDLILSLHPVPPQKQYSSIVAPLLAEVNKRLKSITGIDTFCYLPEALTNQQMMEIKLPLSIRCNGRSIPRHFLIINPQWDQLVQWGQIYEVNPPLAVFKAVEGLTQQTKSLRLKHTDILHQLARELVKEMS